MASQIPSPPVLLASSHPDPHLLDPLARMQRIYLLLVGVISITILVAWLSPALAALFPEGWSLMRPNTALAMLLSVLSLVLSQPKRSPAELRASRILALIVLITAFTIFLEYASNNALKLGRFNQILDLDFYATHPGRMSPQTAAALTFLGVVMLLLRVRKRLLSHVADIAVLLLGLMTLTILSGYLFGAIHLFGVSMQNRTSPQTLFALCLLTLVAYTRRAEYGFHSVLLSLGIGGKTARLAMPFAIILPFLLEMVRAGSVYLRIIGPQYANAIATSALSIFIVGFTLMVAWRIDSLESAIRDLSLRDELTGLYNRRGFYVLGEQAMRLARRASKPFSVLYLDLDRLKPINDTFGHDVGSEVLQTVAKLLTLVFREVDVIGRIGGDEFVVAGEGSTDGMEIVVERLQLAVAAANTAPGREYSISFSHGYVTRLDAAESFEHMLGRADKIMYEEKRLKKK
ncbi:GGDEF domain-containing protein [Granulicella sp. dw_53]|uniref:GGDEF domain-containing protein n=1 Tax=Granulicella sp. dw_53 TaxID=2719792 RepID=UPI001BD6C1F3